MFVALIGILAALVYEACFDTAIGWRDHSNKVWINFGDEIPQDCNYLECLGQTENNGRQTARAEPAEE